MSSGCCVFGRELSCEYGTHAYAMWSEFKHCKLRSVDLTGEYKAVAHSFTGTAEQKSAVTAVYFHSPLNIDFLPKEILSDCPKFNGIVIESCAQ
jgi:hypothetical protein